MKVVFYQRSGDGITPFQGLKFLFIRGKGLNPLLEYVSVNYFVYVLP